MGSTVDIHHEDCGPWTHGTVEGKGDHNHHEISYNICITRMGWLVTRDRKHIKPTQIMTEQYLRDQLQKHTTTDPLEDILKLEKTTMHKQYSHYKQWTMHKYPNTQMHSTVQRTGQWSNIQASKWWANDQWENSDQLKKDTGKQWWRW